jgi:hypothetical protein
MSDSRDDLGPTRLRHSGPAAHTRHQKRKYPNMHPEPYYHMTDATHRAIRKYNADVRKTKKAAKGKTGGRRRGRKSRSTRRH